MNRIDTREFFIKSFCWSNLRVQKNLIATSHSIEFHLANLSFFRIWIFEATKSSFFLDPAISDQNRDESNVRCNPPETPPRKKKVPQVETTVTLRNFAHEMFFFN